MNILKENKGVISAIVFALITLILVVNGLPKQSEGEKQAQAHMQELVKLVNTQNSFNQKIILEQKNIETQSGVIERAKASISGSLSRIEETSKLIDVTNDRLKKYNLKYGQ